MFSKIAICALIALIVVPAAVLAAGSQGSGNGNGIAQGTLVQQDTAMQAMHRFGDTTDHQYQCNGNQTCAQKQFMYGAENNAQNGNQVTGQGNGKMLQAMSGDQQSAKDMDRNMNQTRLRDGSCGNCVNA